jgi:dynein heavy chain, axonemal
LSVQGIRWIKNREEPNGLTIIQQSQKGYIDKVISCIENGKPLLIENLPDDIDAVLDPVVGKMTMRRGQNLVVKIGDTEVDYDRNFRMYLQTKLANPHYKPEINAQVRMVEDGPSVAGCATVAHGVKCSMLTLRTMQVAT